MVVLLLLLLLTKIVFVVCAFIYLFFLLFIIHFPCPILGESAIVYVSVGLSALCFTMETEEERNWILLQRH